MINAYDNIDGYLHDSGLTVEKKLNDFLIYRFDEVNGDAQITRKAYKQNFYEVSLEFNACCTFQVDGFLCPLDGSRISIIAPNRIQSQHVHHPSTESNRGYTIFFETSFLGDYFNTQRYAVKQGPLSSNGHPALYLNPNQLVELETLFSLIHREYNIYGEKAREVIRRLIEAIFEKLKIWSGQSQSVASSFTTAHFFELLPIYFRSSWGVKDYAEKLGVTPKHLSEKLYEESGLTALEHIHFFKVNEAKGLLKQTTLSVKEIAFQVGFENPEHFNSFFKKLTGISPGQYRKSSQ